MGAVNVEEDGEYVSFGCIQEMEEGEDIELLDRIQSGEVDMLEVQARLGKVDFTYQEVYMMHAGNFAFELTAPDFPELPPFFSVPFPVVQPLLKLTPPCTPEVVKRDHNGMWDGM